MGASYRSYVLVVFFSATAGSFGCGGADSAAVTMPAATSAVNLAVEPNAIVPTLTGQGGCAVHQPFDLRFVVRLGGPHDVSFHRLRFRFEDRFGRIDVPRVSLGPGLTGTTFPTVGPIPTPSGSSLPNSSPIPMPGVTPLMGTLSSFGSARQLPLWLEFGCGVAPYGTLVVIVDFDHHGRSLSSETRVEVR